MVSLKENDSLVISIDKNKWYWFSRRIGDTGYLDFVKKYEGLPFRAAMQKIIGEDEPTYLSFKNPITPFTEKKAAFILPEKASSMDKVYHYLYDLRKIDKRIVDRMVKENRLYQDNRNNCVFVGFNNTGIVRYGLRGGTNPKYKSKSEVKGSNKAYASELNANIISNTILVFESIIDTTSCKTLFGINKNAIVLSGVFDKKYAKTS